MTLLISFFAALTATTAWYISESRDKLKLGMLSLIFWGSSLMWTADFIFEYAELKAEYFNQSFHEILNDTLLGFSVVSIGIFAWLVILLIKDPKGVIRKKLKK